MAAKTAINVFINCPFDSSYKAIFEALIFAIYDLGFVARCALEFDDASTNRFQKICDLIAESPYGVHDISFVKLDETTQLPRFNMPLELGLFLGCRHYGGASQKDKVCLILDTERYRFQKYISDISGQDIHEHRNDPEKAIVVMRDWLCAASKRKKLPGGQAIVTRYRRFRTGLPSLCSSLEREQDKLIFSDWSEMISLWLQANR